MIREIVRNIFYFISVILIQVFILNNIQIIRPVHPFFYVIFILLLPLNTPRWALLTAGFALGITIDIFFHTLGIHAAATVLLAYVRPSVLMLIAPQNNYESGYLPRMSYYGFSWFLKYTFICVLIHHLFLFYIEVFSLADFLHTLGRALLSALLTILLIVFSQFFMFRYK